MSPRRILVTGGCGFIGTHLTRCLRASGHTVTILDSQIAQVHGANAEGAAGENVIRADVRDAEAVRRALAGVEVVYHLAAETGVGQSQYEIARYVGTNTLGTAIVLEAAVAAGVNQVVLTSSRAVYGEGAYWCPSCQLRFSGAGRRPDDMDVGRWEVPCPGCAGPADPLPMAETDAPAPTSIYGVTKLQQEELAQAVSSIYRVPVTILRLFNVFGPGQALRNPYVGVLGTFFRQAVAGCAVDLYEDGQMSRDFVFIDDVVHALRSVLDHPGLRSGTFNVGTGSSVKLADLAQHLFDCLEIPPDIVVSGRYRIGDVRHAVANTTRLESALADRPATGLVSGLAAYVEWARAHPSHAVGAVAEAELASRKLLRRSAQ